MKDILLHCITSSFFYYSAPLYVHNDVLCMCYVCTGDEKPEPKDLERFLTEYGLEWRAIGLQLGLKPSVLNLIDAGNPNKHRECFRLTLDKWLQLDLEATWSKLELAITNANRLNLNISTLSTSKLHTYNWLYEMHPS